MKVNTWIYDENQEFAKELLKTRGEWGKFVNTAITLAQQYKDNKLPISVMRPTKKGFWALGLSDNVIPLQPAREPLNKPQENK